MGLIESFFQKNDINYGWVMVVVVFTLSGLAFGSMASISVFLKPVLAFTLYFCFQSKD